MRRYTPVLILFIAMIAIAGHAFAQATAPANAADVSWSALDPGNDWAAQAIQSVFPVNGTATNSTGAEATVIGKIVGQFSGFVGALAMVFVCYQSIINIHRGAETTNL